MFQVCWFACLLLALKSSPWLALILVIASAFIQNIKNPNKKLELISIITITVFGTMLDSLGIFLGAFSFPSDSGIIWAYPIWMSALWLNFGTILNSSLSWLQERYAISFFMGLLGGPFAYLGGEKFGVIDINGSYGVIVIATLWAFITPTCFFLSKFIYRNFK